MYLKPPEINQSEQKGIDLFIVNHNSTDFLHDCLSSIDCTCNGLRPHIIVIDSDSDEPVRFIRKSFAMVDIVQCRENKGYAQAVNRYIRDTSAPYVVMMNPDTIVLSDGFFYNIAEFMESHPDVGIMGPEVLNPDGSIQGSARSFPKFHSILFGRKSLLTRLLPNCRFTRANILTGKADRMNPVDVDWVSGACMVVRRKALDEVGLLDEGFFLYWEDVDLCRRMWNRGWKVKYWRGVSIMHHVGGSSNSSVVRPVFEFHKSAMRYFSKHITAKRALLLPPIYMGILLRFVGILVVRALQKYMVKPVQKEGTAYEAAQTWLKKACLEKSHIPENRR